MKSLNAWHPISAFVYFIGVVAISMVATSPIIVLLSFLSGIAMNYCLLDTKKANASVAICVGLFLVIALSNPLFVRKGMTILFYINNKPYTLEALLYGVNIGLQIGGVLLWLKCFNAVISEDKIVYIFGKFTPKMALILAMSLSSIPILTRQYKKIDQVQKTLGAYSSKNLFKHIKTKLLVMQILFNWAIESSITKAENMTAKGYELKPKTRLELYKKTKGQIFWTILLGLLLVGALLISLIGVKKFGFYPDLSTIDMSNIAIISYVLSGLLFFIGVVVELKEIIKWRWLTSKI